MAVVFKAESLQKQVMSNLRDNVTYLNSSKNILSSIDIPTDFKYYTQLKNYPQNISDIVSEIKSIEKWLDKVIINFKNTEKKNAQVMNQILISTMNMTLSTVKTQAASKALDETGAKIDKTNTNNSSDTKAKNTVSNIFNWVTSGKWLTAAKDVATRTASKVVTTAKSGIATTLNTGAKVAKKATTSISKAAHSAISFVGSKVTSACKWSYNHIIKPGWSFIKSTAASVANIVAGVIKGLCQFIESLLDLIVMLGTAVGSVFTGIYDGVTYVKSVIAGNTDDWSSKTASMWANVMGFVAEDHVDNVFKNFYQNTMLGKWLDENAAEWFKSNGFVTNVASGIGYVSGLVALTLATAGVGGAGVATANTIGTGTGIAVAAGTGKYTAEHWAKMRDSSWEGIERFYKKGQITEEQYNSYKMIRNLDEQQWKSIENDFKNGNITKEEYEQIKQIRELPEDWTTLENGFKGLGYGISNGIWEGIQWYVGSKLAVSVISKTSQAANSAIRVGIDTGFNALDTPFRTTTESLASGKRWEQVWIEQGGWKSVLSNAGIGLVGSAGGEVVNITKIKKGNKNINFKRLNPKKILKIINFKKPNASKIFKKLKGSKKINFKRLNPKKILKKSNIKKIINFKKPNASKIFKKLKGNKKINFKKVNWNLLLKNLTANNTAISSKDLASAIVLTLAPLGIRTTKSTVPKLIEILNKNNSITEKESKQIKKILEKYLENLETNKTKISNNKSADTKLSNSKSANVKGTKTKPSNKSSDNKLSTGKSTNVKGTKTKPSNKSANTKLSNNKSTNTKKTKASKHKVIEIVSELEDQNQTFIGDVKDDLTQVSEKNIEDLENNHTIIETVSELEDQNQTFIGDVKDDLTQVSEKNMEDLKDNKDNKIQNGGKNI